MSPSSPFRRPYFLPVSGLEGANPEKVISILENVHAFVIGALDSYSVIRLCSFTSLFTMATLNLNLGL